MNMKKALSFETLNNSIKNCKKCSLFETRQYVLCGEGDINARIMLIAQAPGEFENKEGRMFIGPSGKVLDELFKQACLKRKNFYITNLVKCMLPQCRRPKQIEIQTCGNYLDKEIELVDPEFIVPLGYFATRYIFEKYGIPVPDKKEFKEVFGKLLWRMNRKIYSLQHPASALHKPELMEVLKDNYHKLKIFSEKCKWHSSCPLRWFTEQGRLNPRWQQLYCFGDWEDCVRFDLEESGKYHPDWMLPDGSMDESLR